MYTISDKRCTRYRCFKHPGKCHIDIWREANNGCLESVVISQGDPWVKSHPRDGELEVSQSSLTLGPEQG